MTTDAPTPAELDEWVARLAPELGLDAADVPTGRVLDLARDVAHGVARPGAPVSAFVVGLAVGRGLDLDEALARVDALLAERRD
ncbi:hypothetical protein FLP10_04175 [Agromyces intestinalis]|uniref:DUF6457 domain-containing protein n=1 Tax=Agromyces intestinalis TaxID=2592652 RepID=A0A5C1YE50_9MICO|nr:DUF6457 domain-containing protein [Agromyces intestinalis]QEO13705.1 hypothetical protein FLP10_04175 [Agromyces intestinalis]